MDGRWKESIDSFNILNLDAVPQVNFDEPVNRYQGDDANHLDERYDTISPDIYTSYPSPFSAPQIWQSSIYQYPEQKQFVENNVPPEFKNNLWWMAPQMYAVRPPNHQSVYLSPSIHNQQRRLFPLPCPTLSPGVCEPVRCHSTGYQLAEDQPIYQWSPADASGITNSNFVSRETNCVKMEVLSENKCGLLNENIPNYQSLSNVTSLYTQTNFHNETNCLKNGVLNLSRNNHDQLISKDISSNQSLPTGTLSSGYLDPNEDINSNYEYKEVNFDVQNFSENDNLHANYLLLSNKQNTADPEKVILDENSNYLCYANKPTECLQMNEKLPDNVDESSKGSQDENRNVLNTSSVSNTSRVLKQEVETKSCHVSISDSINRCKSVGIKLERESDIGNNHRKRKYSNTENKSVPPNVVKRRSFRSRQFSKEFCDKWSNFADVPVDLMRSKFTDSLPSGARKEPKVLDKKFVCHICTKPFVNHYSYTCHINRHKMKEEYLIRKEKTKKISRNVFHCAACKQTWFTKENFENHCTSIAHKMSTHQWPYNNHASKQAPLSIDSSSETRHVDAQDVFASSVSRMNSCSVNISPCPIMQTSVFQVSNPELCSSESDSCPVDYFCSICDLSFVNRFTYSKHCVGQTHRSMQKGLSCNRSTQSVQSVVDVQKQNSKKSFPTNIHSPVSPTESLTKNCHTTINRFANLNFYRKSFLHLNQDGSSNKEVFSNSSDGTVSATDSVDLDSDVPDKNDVLISAHRNLISHVPKLNLLCDAKTEIISSNLVGTVPDIQCLDATSRFKSNESDNEVVQLSTSLVEEIGICANCDLLKGNCSCTVSCDSHSNEKYFKCVASSFTSCDDQFDTKKTNCESVLTQSYPDHKILSTLLGHSSVTQYYNEGTKALCAEDSTPNELSNNTAQPETKALKGDSGIWSEDELCSTNCETIDENDDMLTLQIFCKNDPESDCSAAEQVNIIIDGNGQSVYFDVQSDDSSDCMSLGNSESINLPLPNNHILSCNLPSPSGTLSSPPSPVSWNPSNDDPPLSQVVSIDIDNKMELINFGFFPDSDHSEHSPDCTYELKSCAVTDGSQQYDTQFTSEKKQHLLNNAKNVPKHSKKIIALKKKKTNCIKKATKRLKKSGVKENHSTKPKITSKSTNKSKFKKVKKPLKKQGSISLNSVTEGTDNLCKDQATSGNGLDISISCQISKNLTQKQSQNITESCEVMNDSSQELQSTTDSVAKSIPNVWKKTYLCKICDTLYTNPFKYSAHFLQAFHIQLAQNLGYTKSSLKPKIGTKSKSKNKHKKVKNNSKLH